MQTFEYVVSVDAEDREKANQVMSERINYEEEYASVGNYGITYGLLGDRINSAIREREKTMRQEIIEALETPLEVDDLNRVLDALNMDPVLTAVEVDLTITMRAVLDITSNEISTLEQAKKALTAGDFTTDERGGIRMSHMSSHFEVRDTEDVDITVKRVDQRI